MRRRHRAGPIVAALARRGGWWDAREGEIAARPDVIVTETRLAAMAIKPNVRLCPVQRVCNGVRETRPRTASIYQSMKKPTPGFPRAAAIGFASISAQGPAIVTNLGGTACAWSLHAELGLGQRRPVTGRGKTNAHGWSESLRCEMIPVASLQTTCCKGSSNLQPVAHSKPATRSRFTTAAPHSMQSRSFQPEASSGRGSGHALQRGRHLCSQRTTDRQRCRTHRPRADTVARDRGE